MTAVSPRPEHAGRGNRFRPALRENCIAKALLTACILTVAMFVQSAAAEVTGSDDDLSCAAGFTVAAFAIQSVDSNAAEYYADRAAAAGKRYLQIHPGETELSYQALMVARARRLQEQLALRSLTAEALVNQIARCEQNSDSMMVS